MNEHRLQPIRDGYDRIASEYVAHIAGELEHKPFDRDLLDRFAAMVEQAGPVLDVGCGPGHVTRYLHERGVSITGLDLSPGMIAEARRLNPDVVFQSGSMLALDEESDLAGIVAFYSIIHVDRDTQPAMFCNWCSSLRPGGRLLVSFHIGTADRHVEEMWGVPVEIDFLFFTPEEIRGRLEGAGFAIIEMFERDPYPEHEVATRRAYILARRPPDPPN